MNKFKLEKAVELLLYVTSKISNMHKVFKIIYFADKAHLNKYGRLLCGDRYIAMDYGPVPSNIYDIVKEVRGDSIYKLDGNLDQVLSVENNNNILPKRDAKLEYLSESDIECLDESIDKHINMTFGELVELSHDDKAYESAKLDFEISFENLIKSLPNADLLLEDLNG